MIATDSGGYGTRAYMANSGLELETWELCLWRLELKGDTEFSEGCVCTGRKAGPSVNPGGGEAADGPRVQVYQMYRKRGGETTMAMPSGAERKSLNLRGEGMDEVKTFLLGTLETSMLPCHEIETTLRCDNSAPAQPACWAEQLEHKPSPSVHLRAIRRRWPRGALLRGAATSGRHSWTSDAAPHPGAKLSPLLLCPCLWQVSSFLPVVFFPVYLQHSTFRGTGLVFFLSIPVAQTWLVHNSRGCVSSSFLFWCQSPCKRPVHPKMAASSAGELQQAG